MMGQKQAATSARMIPGVDGDTEGDPAPVDELRLGARVLDPSFDAPVPGDRSWTQGDLVAAGPGAQPDLQVEEGEFQERTRQIEERLKAKLRRYLEAELGEAIRATADDPAGRDHRW
jgi:hypothetical protein